MKPLGNKALPFHFVDFPTLSNRSIKGVRLPESFQECLHGGLFKGTSKMVVAVAVGQVLVLNLF